MKNKGLKDLDKLYLNLAEYQQRFGIGELSSGSEVDGEVKSKAEKALNYALDIRKFEIELYWKRATYFWTLIAAAFVGHLGILATVQLNDKNFYAYLVACVGLLFTWAWFLANRGSKFWQENWENHVDMLENEVCGPLYKTILSRSRRRNWSEWLITGPLEISVSKLNQWVSLFMLIIWTVLVWRSLPRDPELYSFGITQAIYRVGWRFSVVGIITIISAIAMVRRGKTHTDKDHYKARLRESTIK